GELLHTRRDEPLVPRFSVPTVAPVRVPIGPCRLRLSRPGALSGTYSLDVMLLGSGSQRWKVGARPALRFAGALPDDSLLVLHNATESFDRRIIAPDDSARNPQQHLWPQP